MTRLRLALTGLGAAVTVLASYRQMPVLAGLGVIIFFTGLWIGKLTSWRRYAVWLGGSALLFVLAYYGFLTKLLILASILAPWGLAYIFLRSLMPGHTPLVTAIGEAARGPLGPKMRRYTLGVTTFWGGYLLLTGVYGGLSLWPGLSHYLPPGPPLVLAGVLFVAEYYLRRRCFPDHDHPAFIPYLMIVARAMSSKPNTQQPPTSHVTHR